MSATASSRARSELAAVAARSRERRQHRRAYAQQRPGRTYRPDLFGELGNHHRELERARHPLRVELVFAGERKERLEELGRRERRTKIADPVGVLLAVVPEPVRGVGRDRDGVARLEPALHAVDFEHERARQQLRAALLPGVNMQWLGLVRRRADAVDSQQARLELDERHPLARARVADLLSNMRHRCLLITTGSEASVTVA